MVLVVSALVSVGVLMFWFWVTPFPLFSCLKGSKWEAAMGRYALIIRIVFLATVTVGCQKVENVPCCGVKFKQKKHTHTHAHALCTVLDTRKQNTRTHAHCVTSVRVRRTSMGHAFARCDSNDLLFLFSFLGFSSVSFLFLSFLLLFI